MCSIIKVWAGILVLRRFDQLQKIDTEGVEPCTRSSLAEMLAAGKDEPHDFENR